MIHLIENYYAAPNNMGFTLLKDKGRKDKEGNPVYETMGYCGSFEEVVLLLKRRVVADRLQVSMELSDALQIIRDTTKEITDAMKGVCVNDQRR